MIRIVYGRGRKEKNLESELEVQVVLIEYLTETEHRVGYNARFSI
jgi:hypothetical protein